METKISRKCLICFEDVLNVGVDIPDDFLDKIVAGREDIELRSTYPDEEGFYHDGKDVEADWGRN